MNKDIRVLVVDDEMSIRGVVANVLRDDGYDVTFAESAEEALRLFTASPRHIVISDIIMSGMTGIDLLYKIKELRKETEVIIMTSHASLETSIEALRAGAFDYLIKPFDDIQIISSITARAAERFSQTMEHKILINALKRGTDEANDAAKPPVPAAPDGKTPARAAGLTISTPPARHTAPAHTTAPSKGTAPVKAAPPSTPVAPITSASPSRTAAAGTAAPPSRTTAPQIKPPAPSRTTAPVKATPQDRTGSPAVTTVPGRTTPAGSAAPAARPAAADSAKTPDEMITMPVADDVSNGEETFITDVEVVDDDAATRPAVLSDAASLMNRAGPPHRTPSPARAASPVSGGASTNPKPVLEHIYNLIKQRFEENKIKLELEPVSNLPDVLCAAGSLERIMIHALVNSQLRLQGTSGTIKIAAREIPPLHQGASPPQHVAIRIIDSGPLIPAVILTKFTESLTARSAGRTVPSGFAGLLVCLGIVKEQHGTMHIKSDPAQGTSFVFVLPVAGSKPAAKNTALTELPLSGGSFKSDRRNTI